MTHQKISASGLIMDKDGQILLVKRSDDDDFLPGVYELPGGGTDFKEHPVEGLKREIREEVGLDVSVGHPLTTFSFMMDHEGVNKHTVEIIYLCKLEDQQDVRLSHEHSDYQWVRFDQLEGVETTKFMRDLLVNLSKHPLTVSA